MPRVASLRPDRPGLPKPLDSLIRNRWAIWPGTAGRFQPERPDDLSRNEWTLSSGMGGRFHRNTHLSRRLIRTCTTRSLTVAPVIMDTAITVMTPWILKDTPLTSMETTDFPENAQVLHIRLHHTQQGEKARGCQVVIRYGIIST